MSPVAAAVAPFAHASGGASAVAGVNRGTTLFCDGQASVGVKTGDRVVVRRFPKDILLVENPTAHEWRTLAEKLNWAASQRYNHDLPK